MPGRGPPAWWHAGQQRRPGAMTRKAWERLVPGTPHALAGIGLGTVPRQPQQDPAQRAGPPAADLPGGGDAVVVRPPGTGAGSPPRHRRAPRPATERETRSGSAAARGGAAVGRGRSRARRRGNHAGLGRGRLPHLPGLRQPASHSFAATGIAPLRPEGERPARTTPASAPPPQARGTQRHQTGSLRRRPSASTRPPGWQQRRRNRPVQGATAPSGEAALDAGTGAEPRRPFRALTWREGAQGPLRSRWWPAVSKLPGTGRRAETQAVTLAHIAHKSIAKGRRSWHN
jgi:hypothetical protein